MSLEQNVLLVIDPTADSHPAVDRLIKLVAREGDDFRPNVTLLFIADTHSINASSAGVYCDNHFILNILNPLREIGLDVSTRISWSKDWTDSILHTADEVEASSIMINHPGAGVNKHLTDEFWYLIRNSNVPVSIIQSSDGFKMEKILVAMDLTDTELRGLNRRIFETGKLIAGSHSAELHLVCAYESSLNYPDRGRIVNLTGIPNENIHIEMGHPDDVLSKTANSLDVEMVMIGATRRTGIKAALRGKTMSKIFNKLQRDLFVVV